MLLDGVKIIITGGASGIAAATVINYVKAGAKVVSMDISDTAGQEIVNKANAIGPGKAYYRHCNIAVKKEVEAAFEEVAGLLGGLDVLANIAGVERRGNAESIPEEEFAFVFGINIYGTIFTNQCAFKYMKEKGGRIINYTSHASINPYTLGAAYSASKGAVTSWTRTVAHEWGKYKITVNCVAPAIWTKMFEEFRARLTAEELAGLDARHSKQIPIGGKLGDPDKDLGPVMVFLASEGAHFITGQMIPVDGGLMWTR